MSNNWGCDNSWERERGKSLVEKGIQAQGWDPEKFLLWIQFGVILVPLLKAVLAVTQNGDGFLMDTCLRSWLMSGTN